MDSLISELELLTEQFIGELEETTDAGFEQFVQKRDRLIEQIKAAIQGRNGEQFKATYGERVRAILKHDERILEKMQAMKNQASGGMRKIQSGRMQKKAYQHAYTPDGGAFFDKRK